jgi:ferric-dicitrate binding protein FerR (iron transport regulator)
MRPLNRWLSAAAAVVIMLGVGFFYLQSLEPTLEAPLAQRAEAVLPDASEILLNAGSEITYNEAQWSEDRRIELKGEAFFKVARGETFTVETPTGKVTVLGTQFNVQQRGTVFIVSCYEGLVRVDYKGESLELPAGRSFRVVGNKTETIDIQEGAVPGWTRNESTFRSMPLSFVLEELERQYDIEVTFGDIDTNRIFSGSFSNTNMDLALKSISAPLQLNYEVKGNKVLLYAENAR